MSSRYPRPCRDRYIGRTLHGVGSAGEKEKRGTGDDPKGEIPGSSPHVACKCFNLEMHFSEERSEMKNSV